MGTISLPYTFVAGQTPTATQWNSNPTTIATLVNGQIDKANVDSAGTDGIVTMDETQTISGAKTFSGAVINTGGITVKDVDNATGAVQTNLTLEWDPADGNNLTDNTSGIGIDFKMPDDADNQDVFASLNVMCVSDATTTENGEFSFKVMTDGTNSEVMTLQSTLGAAGTVLTLATAEPTVVDGDVLGRIDFQAPSEGSGTDAILVGASIYAEADDTFASGLNDTDLVFAVAESETAAERMRLSYDGTTVGLSFSGAATIDSGGNNALGLNAGTEDVVVTASNIEPASNDGSALGTSGTAWSDLFLADGGVINFNAGNLTVTHSAGVLTVNGNIAATDLDGIIGSNTAAAGTFTTVTSGGVTILDTGATATAVQANLTLEWNPSNDSNMTDNSSGVGIDFKMPDDADNQIVFGSLDVMCVSDVDGAEKGGFSFKAQSGGGAESEIMTLETGLTTTGTVMTLATAEATVVDDDVLGRIDFRAPAETGTDALEVCAFISAVATDTFAADNNATELVFATGSSEAATAKVRIDSVGNLLVGDVAGYSGRVGTLQVKGQGSNPGQLSLIHGSSAGDGDFITLMAETSTNKHIFMWDNGTDMRFATASNVGGSSYSEMMRIETSGDVGIGTTPDATTRFHVVSPHANQTAYLENSSSGNSYGLYLHLSGATNDNETTTFIDAADATARRAVCFSNGDWENHDNSYGGISDVKLKTDIRDVRSYWDNFKALEYKKFKFKSDVEYSKNRPAEIAAEIVELKEELDDTDSETKLTTEEIVRLNAEIARLESEVVADATDRLGLIAQDVEDIFPALVRHTPDRAEDTDIDSATFGEFIDLDTETLGLKNSIIDGVINSIVLQEAMARIETLETKVTALENA